MTRYFLETEDEDEDDWDSPYALVFRQNDDGTKTQVGRIGGDPEDNSYYRTYSWIVEALNDAYELGVEHSRGNKE